VSAGWVSQAQVNYNMKSRGQERTFRCRDRERRGSYVRLGESECYVAMCVSSEGFQG